MNQVEKMWALLVSKEVNIWHFHQKREPPRYFWYQRGQEHACFTLEQLVEEAYAVIDPLRRPLPACAPSPRRPSASLGRAVATCLVEAGFLLGGLCLLFWGIAWQAWKGTPAEASHGPAEPENRDAAGPPAVAA